MDFGLLSVLYLFGAGWTLWQLPKKWRGFFADYPDGETRRLANTSAFLLLTPPAVYLHELGHALAVQLLGARLIGISFFFYWGFTSYTGRLTPSDSWIIAAAGPAVTFVLGWLALGIGLSGPFRPAINLLVAQFGLIQLFQILVFYPLLTLANFGDLSGSDFSVLYSSATPSLQVLTGVIHIGSLVLLVAGYRLPFFRGRYRLVTAGGTTGDVDAYPSANAPAPGSIYAALLKASESPEPASVPALPDDRDETPSPVEPPPAPALLAAIEALVARPSAETRAEAERLFALDENGRRLNDVVAPMLEKKLDFTVLYGEMRALTVRSDRRGAVKYGLAITGLFSRPANEQLFLTLARHPAFTRLAAAGLGNIRGSLVRAVLEVWPLSSGLGRVDLVELLLREFSGEHKATLEEEAEAERLLLSEGLVEGYEGYTALRIARSVDLAGALGPDRDPELAVFAGRLLAVLASATSTGQSNGTLDELPQSTRLLELFLERVRSLKKSATVLDSLSRIAGFLRFRGGEVPAPATPLPSPDLQPELSDIGVPSPRRIEIEPPAAKRLFDVAEALILDPGWPPAIRADLQRARGGERLTALAASRVLGIETKEALFDWIAHDPGAHLPEWITALGEQLGPLDVDRFVHAVSLAVLPETAGAPASYPRSLGLVAALEALTAFPGAGWPLVIAALASDTVMCRTQAILLLEEWKAAAYPEEVRAVLERVAGRDEQPSLRNRAAALLGRR